jgi:hypothetical protein
MGQFHWAGGPFFLSPLEVSSVEAFWPIVRPQRLDQKSYLKRIKIILKNIYIIEGSLEVKLPTIWRDEKQSRAEAERRGRLEERISEEKE